MIKIMPSGLVLQTPASVRPMTGKESTRDLVKEKKEGARSFPEKLRVGDKVRHKKFGRGTIVAITTHEGGDELTVVFDSKGLKSLSANLNSSRK